MGEVVDFGSNFEISIRDTVRSIAEVMGVTIKILSEEVRMRPANSEVERLWAYDRKAKALLAWEPAYGGREGFKGGPERTTAWFTDPVNLAGYKADINNF